MNADPVYWATNIAGFDDAALLRFLDAVVVRRDAYHVALTAATTEARRRNLVPNEKGPAMTPGQSGRKT